MAILNEDPGPEGSTHGRMPSAPADRGAPRWLVFSLCNVYAVDAPGPDMARALVLDKLGYGHRPELAAQLDARSASPEEIKLVCVKRRQRPWRIDPRRRHAHEKQIRRIAAIIREHELREHGDATDPIGSRRHSTLPRVLVAAQAMTHRHHGKEFS